MTRVASDNLGSVSVYRAKFEDNSPPPREFEFGGSVSVHRLKATPKARARDYLHNTYTCPGNRLSQNIPMMLIMKQSPPPPPHISAL